jgi:leukotriene-A4 hydrolase
MLLQCVNGNSLPGVFVIDELMSESECDSTLAAIDQSASLSFWNSAGRENLSARLFRNADTIEVQSALLADELWSRISSIFPVPDILIRDESDHDWERELVGVWTAKSLNSDMLFAKYPCGGYFAPHTDGRAVHDFNRRSFYSVIIFLNSIPQGCGGGTKFFEQKSTESLKLSACQNYWVADPSMLLGEIFPVAGRMLIFHQSLVHEGVAPTSGHFKYIIRSDIMFERSPPLCSLPTDIDAYRIYREG